MPRLGLVPFRPGAAAATALSTECLDFYLWVAGQIAADTFASVGADDVPTVPLDSHIIESSPFAIYAIFLQQLKQLPPSASHILVDLGSAPDAVIRGSVLLHLGHALVEVARADDDALPAHSPRRFILILDELPPTTDAFSRLVGHLLTTGRLVIADRNGTLIGDGTPAANYTPSEWALRYARAYGDPRVLLAKKMIRRLGHFRLSPSAPSRCHRYFYDGRLCRGQLAQLLGAELQRLGISDATTTILYHCPMSPWLEEAVVAATVPLGLEALNIGDLDRATTASTSLVNQGSALVIVDMLHTGDTLAALLDWYKSGGAPWPPTLLSILATGSDGFETRTRRVYVDGAAMDVRFFLPVVQEVYSESGGCPMCSLGVPVAPYFAEPFHMLSSYDLWTMARDAGVKPEENVPGYRASLGPVVDWPRVIAEHGAWFASKVHQRLSDSPEGFPPDPVIVCPAAEAGSSVLAEYLRLALGVSVIPVPREVIDRCRNSIVEKRSLTDATLGSTDGRWLDQIRSVPGKTGIIVMDEFKVSGGTFVGLRAILGYLAKSVRCLFPLIDFDPRSSRNSDIPVYCLYEWQRDG